MVEDASGSDTPREDDLEEMMGAVGPQGRGPR